MEGSTDARRLSKAASTKTMRERELEREGESGENGNISNQSTYQIFGFLLHQSIDLSIRSVIIIITHADKNRWFTSSVVRTRVLLTFSGFNKAN